MFSSKRAFNALVSSFRCSGDKSFLLMFRAVAALIAVASLGSYLLLRCSATWGFVGLSLRSYQFAFSAPLGVHPSVHPRLPPAGEYACVPSFQIGRAHV